MKLSKETIEILKNFASINMSMLFREGTKLKTISPPKTVMAVANISETIPREFAIYDLNQLIGLMSMFDDPDLKFGDKMMHISDKTDEASFVYASASAIISAPDKEVSLPGKDIKFLLEGSALNRALRAAGFLNVEQVAILGEGGKTYITALDTNSDATHSWKTAVGTSDTNYRMIFRRDNLKLLPRDYTVTIAAKGISKFASATNDVTYYVATETASTYGTQS